MNGESSKLPLVIVGAALAVISFLVLGLAMNMERVERVVRSGATGEARANPLLAAERLLERMGLEADSTRRLNELPPLDHVIVFAAEDRVLTDKRTDRLLEWVDAGGALIVGPHLDDGHLVEETWNDLLLDRLGVEVEEYEDDDSRPSREVVAMDAIDGEGTLDVEFFSNFGLAMFDEPEEDAGTYALIWVEHGAGFVAVLNDLRFAHSTEIGKLAHARYFWELVDAFEDRSKVLLVYGWGNDSIWTLLGRHAWPLLMVGGLLLFAWAWRGALRFGPLIESPDSKNRALMEHVDALGHFMWRANRADTLIASARGAIERQIHATRPDLVTGDREHQLQQLARGTGIDTRTIEAAMFGSRFSRREDFTRTIRTLERLRRAL